MPRENSKRGRVFRLCVLEFRIVESKLGTLGRVRVDHVDGSNASDIDSEPSDQDLISIDHHDNVFHNKLI